MTNPNSQPKISMIAAIASGTRALGNKGDLIFRISDDLKRFKTLTSGHAIIMGRKTYESIGKPLPNRLNVVITRHPDFKAERVLVCTSIEEAIQKSFDYEMQNANENKEVFIIGGGEIFTQALPKTDRLYMTIVESDLTGDSFFPDYSDFKKVIKKESRVDEKTGLKYEWIDLER